MITPKADAALLVYEEARETLDRLHTEILDYADYCQLVNALDYSYGLVGDKEAVIEQLEKALNNRPVEKVFLSETELYALRSAAEPGYTVYTWTAGGLYNPEKEIE